MLPAEANVALIEVEAPEGCLYLVLVALKDVAADQELLLDYGARPALAATPLHSCRPGCC